jgi:ABC-type Fe3+-siderophore transport system permease subunit
MFLFKNPGNKIKIFSLILFLLMFLGSIVGAFLLSKLFPSNEKLMLVVFILSGIILSYVISVFLYAIGELIQSNTDIKNGVEYLCRMREYEETKNER